MKKSNLQLRTLLLLAVILFCGCEMAKPPEIPPEPERHVEARLAPTQNPSFGEYADDPQWGQGNSDTAAIEEDLEYSTSFEVDGVSVSIRRHARRMDGAQILLKTGTLDIPVTARKLSLAIRFATPISTLSDFFQVASGLERINQSYLYQDDILLVEFEIGPEFFNQPEFSFGFAMADAALAYFPANWPLIEQIGYCCTGLEVAIIDNMLYPPGEIEVISEARKRVKILIRILLR